MDCLQLPSLLTLTQLPKLLDFYTSGEARGSVLMEPTMLDGIRYFKCRGVCQGPAPFSTYTCYDLPEGLSMVQCLDCLFVTVAMDEQALKRKPRTLEGEFK